MESVDLLTLWECEYMQFAGKEGGSQTPPYIQDGVAHDCNTVPISFFRWKDWGSVGEHGLLGAGVGPEHSLLSMCFFCSALSLRGCCHTFLLWG